MANTKISKKMLLGDGREREAVLPARGWESTEEEIYLFCLRLDLILGVA